MKSIVVLGTIAWIGLGVTLAGVASRELFSSPFGMTFFVAGWIHSFLFATSVLTIKPEIVEIFEDEDEDE